MNPEKFANELFEEHLKLCFGNKIMAKKHAIVSIRVILDKEKQRSISSVILFYSNALKIVETLNV